MVTWAAVCPVEKHKVSPVWGDIWSCIPNTGVCFIFSLNDPGPYGPIPKLHLPENVLIMQSLITQLLQMLS